jgi:thiamine kinase-like enzyme
MDMPLKAETALDSWREWDADLFSRPVLVKPLSAGRSNRSFLLDSNGRKMVLRINGSEQVLPNSERSSEIGIWQAASEKGIAPPLLYFDEQTGFLVSAYIENNLPAKPRRDARLVDNALNLLNQCHQLIVKAPPIDYSRHIEQYWKIIEEKGAPINPALTGQRDPMQLLLEKLLNSSNLTNLCHHDPVKENFVGSLDRLYLIDWEYAAYGLPVMDYAALSVEWEVENAVVLEQTGIDPGSLTMSKALYRYLCQLWEAITEDSA